MKLDFIPLDKLSISKANMRYGKKAPDVSDILPTIRARGVIQPVIVRPNCGPGQFEIVAGSRRFHAAKIVADERRSGGDPDAEPMPCAILDDGDDAAAIEASMIENMARLDADEVSQWESFTRLVKEGRKVDEIAATFGLPDLTVRRVLALSGLGLFALRGVTREGAIVVREARFFALLALLGAACWTISVFKA